MLFVVLLMVELVMFRVKLCIVLEMLKLMWLNNVWLKVFRWLL